MKMTGGQMSKLHILGFAANAPAMCGAGWAVMPARGKEPIRKGYRKWRFAPALATIAKWADENPEADIVYVPGLSRAKRGGPGIVVVDASTPTSNTAIPSWWHRGVGTRKIGRSFTAGMAAMRR